MVVLVGIKKYENLLQFQGFEYSHLTNQKEEQKLTSPITNTNCHLLTFESSGWRKTSFLKHYLDQTKSDYLVFRRDENEFHEQNFVQLLQFKNIVIESLANKTIILEDAG